DGLDDDSLADAQRCVTARLPQLPCDPYLCRRRHDGLLPDERLRPDRRLPPPGPLQERQRLPNVEQRAPEDGEDPPRPGHDEHGEQDPAEQQHSESLDRCLRPENLGLSDTSSPSRIRSRGDDELRASCACDLRRRKRHLVARFVPLILSLECSVGSSPFVSRTASPPLPEKKR